MNAITGHCKIFTSLAAATAVGLLLTAAALAWPGPAFHHASGGGQFEASGNEFMFAFNARQLNVDGDAMGQFEFHNRTNQSLLHMKIVHMELLGETTVGLIGEVTKSVGTNAGIGDCRAVKLQDNGEGKNAPLDMTSKLSSKCGYWYVGDWDDGSFGLFTLANGNIQIR